MLSGDNGILQRATQSKEKTERAEIIESAQLDVLAEITDNKGENITKQQLASVLNNYFKPTETTSIPDEISSTRDVDLKTIDDKYTVKLSEIYMGKLKGDDASVRISFSIKNEVNSTVEGTFPLSCIEGTTWKQWAESTSNPMYMNTANQSCGMFQGSLQDLILGRQNPEWFEVTFYPDKIGCEYGSTTIVLV